MSIVVTASNVDKIIADVKKQIRDKQVLQPSEGFIFPRTFKGGINRKLYRGRGRPRNSDYKRISVFKTLKKLGISRETNDYKTI